MSIIHEILSWSRGRPLWQQDAIRRLFERGALSEGDLQDLYALLATELGIADPQGRKAVPLTVHEAPPPEHTDERFTLVAMKNLLRVNALAPNTRLEFGKTGLTVIYGDNGSGKSGYTRALKRACRARDQSEPILPNAASPEGQTGTAEATFEVEVDGAAREYKWTDGGDTPPPFSALAVFDARCARAYLDQEGDFAYIPYGLDILEGLAEACNALKGMLEKERAQSEPDRSAFTALVGDTEVGKLIATLSGATRAADVEALACLTEDEISERLQLEKTLREPSPEAQAEHLTRRANRIARLAQSAVSKLAALDDSAAEELKALSEAARNAQAAAELAALKFGKDGSLLPGTGGESWKALFEAARNFSADAYPDRTFPDLGQGTPCPLCQQPLDAGAARLARFDAFIQQDAEKTARARKKELNDAFNAFGAKDPILGADEELYTELHGLDPVTTDALRHFQSVLAARHQAIQAAALSADWSGIGPVPSSPHARLEALVAQIRAEVGTLHKAAGAGTRTILEVRSRELNARQRLSEVKASVLRAIDLMARQAKLFKGLSAVKPNAITTKSKELTEKVVSEELKIALNREFKLLGADELQVSLKSRPDRGKCYHKLKIELPQAKTLKDILSEGEQRAIAVGAFLAEVTLGGGTGGVVFDDPVSSLDHRRREKIARRLAQEAAKRQVIVFTHDVYFVGLLEAEADQDGIAVEIQALVRGPQGFGITSRDLPFEGMNTKGRVAFLRDLQQRIGKLYQTHDERAFREQTFNAYVHLRRAWEHAVEEVLFRKVVVRFRKSIQTQSLKYVLVGPEDLKPIDKAMTKCSNFAHASAELGGPEIPRPDELLEDINALEAWRQTMDQRRKAIDGK